MMNRAGCEREDIEFVSDGDVVRGWLYRPHGATRPGPVVVMAHGYSAVKEMRLPRFAVAFAAAGMSVVVFDNPTFGASDGEPRQEVDSARQIQAYKDAISWTLDKRFADPDNVGIWGTSYSGGHVVVVAATDSRIKCVVSQVPMAYVPEADRAF